MSSNALPRQFALDLGRAHQASLGPNFTLLRAFEAAARLESFTLAAKELHLTQSAISHQIRDLEDHFGKALFLRKNRTVEPTSEGRRLLDSLIFT